MSAPSLRKKQKEKTRFTFLWMAPSEDDSVDVRLAAVKSTGPWKGVVTLEPSFL